MPADPGPNPMRSFDPRRVGRLECQTWVTYYRREWLPFLRAAIAVTRHVFGLSWPRTLYGAWLVMRANQLWAPHPDNDPDGARRQMRRFYSLVARTHGESLDPGTAARLEVEWWRRGPAEVVKLAQGGVKDPGGEKQCRQGHAGGEVQRFHATAPPLSPPGHRQDDRGRYAIADGWLWVDGRRIYHVRDLGMRLVPGSPGGAAG